MAAFALWISMGETEIQPLSSDFGYPSRDFHFLLALKTFSEEGPQGPDIHPQKYVCLGNTKISPAQKELMAIRAVVWGHTVGISDSLKGNH